MISIGESLSVGVWLSPLLCARNRSIPFAVEVVGR